LLFGEGNWGANANEALPRDSPLDPPVPRPVAGNRGSGAVNCRLRRTSASLATALAAWDPGERAAAGAAIIDKIYGATQRLAAHTGIMYVFRIRRAPRMTELFDWTRLTDDPNDSETKRLVRRRMVAARQIHLHTDVSGFFVSAAAGKRVLDVGVVSHAAHYIRDPDWRHRKIREVAARCVGLDILESLVRDLRAQGYDVRCIDATSEADLGERFDVVFGGDLIEHVDNPVALLRFAKRHLAPGGRVLMSTPNPFSRKFFRRFRRNGAATINLDHIAWYTPTMALELGRRAGLALCAYHLIKTIARWKRPLKRLAWRFVPPEYTFGDYVFEFRLPLPGPA
jgi:SAM-dependent methyltransferase